MAPANNVINFENSSFNYIYEKHNEIISNIGFILSIIAILLLKWIKYDSRKKFNNCISLSEEDLE